MNQHPGLTTVTMAAASGPQAAQELASLECGIPIQVLLENAEHCGASMSEGMPLK